MSADSAGTLDADARARCAAAARWLDASAVVGGVALFAAAVAAFHLIVVAPAVAGGFESQRTAMTGVLALALGERYHALRLRFDRGLFADLAAGRIDGLSRLDAALSGLGLRKSGAAARPLDDRICGARRLWRRHIAIVAVQVSLCAAALLSRW